MPRSLIVVLISIFFCPFQDSGSIKASSNQQPSVDTTFSKAKALAFPALFLYSVYLHTRLLLYLLEIFNSPLTGNFL